MSKRASLALIIALSISCLGWSYSAAKKNDRGNEHYRKGEYEEALKKYSEAMTEAPERPELYFNIGDALYKQSRFPEALKLYEKSAASRDVKYQSKVFYNMGNSRFRAGQAGPELPALQEAAACYVKALELDPGDVDAKYNLEFARREIKKIEEQKKQEEKKKEEKEQQKKEQEKKEQEKKGEKEKQQEQKTEEQKKEQEKREQEKKQQEKEQQEKEQQEKKEKERQEKEQEQQQEQREKQEKEQGGEEQQGQKQEGRPQAEAAAKKDEQELTEKQARELIQSFDREQRDPAHFLETQIAPVRRGVEKDW